MSQVIRAVSPRIPARCPSCHCFVRVDSGTCAACGFAFALAAGTLRAETLGSGVQPCQSGTKGNSLAFSNLLPNGKNKKFSPLEENSAQMSFFTRFWSEDAA